jgi:hypothetical protein
MCRPWFEVLVVFGVSLGELNVFAGDSPDVVNVRPPAEGDDFGAAGAQMPSEQLDTFVPPGAAVAGDPFPFDDVDVVDASFGTVPSRGPCGRRSPLA